MAIKCLDTQIRRNLRTFPENLMLQVTAAEIAEVAAKSNLLQASKCSPAFAEHGAVQAANILNSDDAMEMNVHIVRALIYLRQPIGIKEFCPSIDHHSVCPT
jgi:hypothetical protein